MVKLVVDKFHYIYIYIYHYASTPSLRGLCARVGQRSYKMLLFSVQCTYPSLKGIKTWGSD